MAGNFTLPTENIDEVILRLLALEPNEIDELDYETYKNNLREILVGVTTLKRKIGDTEFNLIKDEFKRVRGKKGRFKIKFKKSKVTANGLGLGGVRKQVAGTQRRLMIAPVGGVPRGAKEKIETVSKGRDSQFNILERISNSLDSIVKTLTDINKDNKKRIDTERKDTESKKRFGKERELESKVFDGIKNVVSAITKPFQSIWDKIINFIKNIILGRILIKLVDWIADPKNQGKIKSIIRFFKDWWPALLGGYVLFGTTFGKLVRSTVGMVGRFIFQIGKVAIPQLLKFIKTPLGKGVALFTAGATIPAMFPGTVNEQERKTSQSPGSAADKIRQLQQQKASLNIFERLQGKGSEIDEQIRYLQTGKTKSYGFNGGGFAGLIRGPKGRDKVPAMLTDGEFVMSAGAVQKYGINTLEAMNASGGGTNQPQVVAGTTYAYGGGRIGGPEKDSGGYSGNLSNDPVSSIKKFIKHKLGYDVDKPNTWGSSFRTGISGISGSGSVSGSRYKFPEKLPNLRDITNRGLELANQSYNTIKNPNIQRDITNRGLELANQSYNTIKNPNTLRYGKDRLNDIGTTIKDKLVQYYDYPLASLEKYGTNREDALIKSGELKPGAALTKTTQANLDKSDAWINSLYDSKRDKGPIGSVKKRFQDIQNKGLFADPTALLGLKSEGFEKFVEKASGGRIKNFGAKLTGLQYAAKGLMGPLGKASRIDDGGSLGRYVRPAMLEAQRRGQGGVGAIGLGQNDYNRLMGDKLANLALGQFNFRVDKSGRATTDDTYEANKSAGEYFKTARQSLKSGDVGGALFKAVSGVLRINQNTGWGNLRPGGLGIDLGGGFTPTDNKGKPLPPTKSKSPVTMYGPNDPRRKQSGSYKSRFARPRNAGVAPVKPPVRPKRRTKSDLVGNGGRSSGIKSSNTQKPKTVSPTHPKGTRTSQSTLGINKR